MLKRTKVILVITDSRGVNRAFVTDSLQYVGLAEALELVRIGALAGLKIVKKRGYSYLRSNLDTSSKNNLETISISAKKLSAKIKEPAQDSRLSLYLSTYSKYLELRFSPGELIYLDGLARIQTGRVISRIRPLSSNIAMAAKQYEIDQNLLAAILIDEMARIGPDDLLDIIGKIGIRDTSVGLAQIKISTAKDLIRNKNIAYKANISDSDLYDLLNDDKVAVTFAAAYISFIKKFRAKKHIGTSPADLASSYSQGLAASISARGKQIVDNLMKLANEILK